MTFILRTLASGGATVALGRTATATDEPAHAAGSARIDSGTPGEETHKRRRLSEYQSHRAQQAAQAKPTAAGSGPPPPPARAAHPPAAAPEEPDHARAGPTPLLHAHPPTTAPAEADQFPAPLQLPPGPAAASAMLLDAATPAPAGPEEGEIIG